MKLPRIDPGDEVEFTMFWRTDKGLVPSHTARAKVESIFEIEGRPCFCCMDDGRWIKYDDCVRVFPPPPQARREHE